MKKCFCIALLSFPMIACKKEEDINPINNNIKPVNSALTVVDYNDFPKHKGTIRTHKRLISRFSIPKHHSF
jgi:hypothetical protein